MVSKLADKDSTTDNGERQAMSSIRLRGPDAPEGYVSDGCTMSPDCWWREACRIHDREYDLLRDINQRIANLNGVLLEDDALSIGTRKQIKAAIRKLRLELNQKKKVADRNLRYNMRELSKGGRTKRLFAWWISRHYYRAVRLFGMRAILR